MDRGSLIGRLYSWISAIGSGFLAALEGYHFWRVDEFRKQQRIKQEQIAEDQKLYDAWIEKTKKEKPKAKKKNDEAPYNWFIDNKGI